MSKFYLSNCKTGWLKLAVLWKHAILQGGWSCKIGLKWTRRGQNQAKIGRNLLFYRQPLNPHQCCMSYRFVVPNAIRNAIMGWYGITASRVFSTATSNSRHCTCSVERNYVNYFIRHNCFLKYDWFPTGEKTIIFQKAMILYLCFALSVR